MLDTIIILAQLIFPAIVVGICINLHFVHRQFMKRHMDELQILRHDINILKEITCKNYKLNGLI